MPTHLRFHTQGAGPITSTAPSFTTQPSAATVTEGATAQFMVATTGTPTITYQWQVNDGSWRDVTGSDGTGGTTDTFTTVATTTGMSTYQYRCVATNGVGSTTSNAAVLTVNASSGMPSKPLPNMDTTGAITVTSGSNLQSQINANPNGTVFYFPNGTYTGIHNVRPKQGNRFIGQSESGVIIQGTTSVKMAFRSNQDDLVFARMTFQGYGNHGTDISQDNGIIDLHDTSAGNNNGFISWHIDDNKSMDSHIHEVTIQNCGNIGIYIGMRTSITDCSFYELSPHAIGGGGGVGGMIHSNYFEECGTSGAPGAGANNAQIKIAWHNIGPWGQTSRDKSVHFSVSGGSSVQQEPLSTLQVVNNTFEGNNNSLAQRGLWFDLDVRDTEVCYNTFQNQNGSGVFYEGCNNGWVHDNTFDNCGNLGAINFSGGFNASYNSKYMSYGAATAAASDHILIEDNTFSNCEAACFIYNGDRGTSPSDWIDDYPVIVDGRMSSGYAPIGPADRSGPGTSNCTVRNNNFTGTSQHVGFWCHPNIDVATESNISTMSFTGNTYSSSQTGGGNFFVWGKTFQNYSGWQGGGRQ